MLGVGHRVRRLTTYHVVTILSTAHLARSYSTARRKRLELGEVWRAAVLGNEHVRKASTHYHADGLEDRQER